MKRVLSVLFWMWRHPWLSLIIALIFYLLFGQFFSSFGMTTSKTMSARGKRWLKILEGFRARAYNDKDKHGKLTNNWTIGYGHLIKPNEQHLMTAELTRAQADELFEKDLKAHFAPVVNLLSKGVRLTQNQMDALGAFFFRAGVGAVDYNIIKYLAEKKTGFERAKVQDFWDNIAHGARGQAEINLFLDGVYKETTGTTIS